MKYKVIKEYKDAPINPINIRKGEILEFVEESNPDGDWPNWIYCKGINKEGWVPKQVLHVDDKKVTSTEDYSAKEHNLMMDEILISERELNGWVWGIKEKSPEVLAWAPLKFLKEI